MFSNKKQRPYITLGIICALPIFFWLADFGVSNTLTTFGTFIASMGKAVAIVGMTLYLINPILSMRHHKIESWMGGLDKVTRLHIQIGKVSFWLIMLHPVLLGIGRFINGRGFTLIWDWSSLVIVLGIIALIGLIAATSISIYAHLKHQNWIQIHRVFGWLIPLFFAHGLLARAQITKIPLLFIFFTVLGLMSFAAFLYRSVWWKYLVKRFTYEVAEVHRLNETIAEVVLKPKGIAMHFTAGQFAFVSFEADGIDPEPHPFSFSNAHNGPYVRFTIKALGDDTKQIQLLKAGTKAYLEGPYGRFNYRTIPNRAQVWIAGGIGITPFLSMARSFAGPDNYDIRFFYGTESLDEAVFLTEFLDITRTLPANFHTSVVAKNISGFVTIDMLKRSLGSLGVFDYMICGPPMMMQTLRSQLIAEGVPDSQIHFESFSMK
jgi:predicted ferric reductase